VSLQAQRRHKSARKIDMETEPAKVINSATSLYARARGLLAQASTYFNQATFNIKRNTRAETIAEIVRRWKLDEKAQLFLIDLITTKAGAAFFDEKVEGINRAAFHRSAFALNASTQLGFVDLAAQLSFWFPQLKIALVAANLVLSWIAHLEMHQNCSMLLAGPNALPPKRRLGGLLSNPAYNRAVKKSSRPYAKSAWKEKSLYRPAYFINALLIFLGSEFIIPAGRIIFPIGFIVGKISGLFSTLVMIFDIWRGIRAGEDARIAREREISVYRHLDI